MKKLLLILVAFVCCLSLFTQDALLIYRQNYAKPLLVALKDISNITYKDAEQVVSLEEWNITSESETTMIDSLVFVDLETLDTKEYAHFVCPDDYHPHMIDLGLPSGVLWSCCNVGASAPEGNGGYYAWGETEEKEVYNDSTYLYCDGSWETCYHIGDDIAGTEYDVAHVKWGSSWKMPSLGQIKELIDNCTRTWTTLNGVIGTLVTGPNGATIFLPASGYRWDDYHYPEGMNGYYWSSTFDTGKDSYETAYIIQFGDGGWDWRPDLRLAGHSVRAVITPEPPKPDCPVAEAIDLGLPSGTKWASWNVGASSSEEYGGYYAWGETEEKDYYDWSTYTHCDGSLETCHYIGDDIAGTEYDVAHVKWGGSWRLPSSEQIQELLAHSTRTWTKQNGIYGTLVTGWNGNSIFLPAAGKHVQDGLDAEGRSGIYWSSSLSPYQGYEASDLTFYSDYWRSNIDPRYMGFAVRAICPPKPSDYISFEDAAVKAICVANWDTNKDGELSYEEAAAVKSLGTVFYEKQGISSFNELQCFTGLTTIEEEAFRECSLKSVSIPKSVTTIGEKAFMQCPNLSEVTLPEGVTWIDEEAFAACALASITLPKSLIRIGEQAFEENPLISVTLPRNVAYLGNSDEDDLYGGVFDYCYSLIEVNVDESNETYASINGMLTTKDQKILLLYPNAKGNSCKVPEGIEQIHYKAFNDCKITSVTLPSTLKSFITEEKSNVGFGSCFDLRTVRAKMKVPFECDYYSFSSETYSSGTLYVPQGTKTLYETTAGWSQFQNIVEDENDCPVAEAIDLGLPSGTKWASWNVGASAPEEYGGFYAWGETEEKDYYAWDSYRHYDGSWDTCIDIGYDIAGTEYDVAHVKWGGSWRMPTKAQLDELIECCTITWTSQESVNGTLVTGPNGATIFLPAAGVRGYEDHYNEGWCGHYWLSSLFYGDEDSANYLYFFSDLWFYDSYEERFYGLSVRPVCP